MSHPYEQDRQAAAQWAHQMLNSDALILDTETTGLGSDAEIVQIAIIDMAGRTILDCLVQPIGAIPQSASAIHGITADVVQRAPTWADLWPVVRSIIAEQTIIIYNADYDCRVLGQSCALAGYLFNYDSSAFKCAMLSYSEFIGIWSDYHGSYKWQRLPGGDHSALGDCRATLVVLQKMAESI